MENSIEMIWKQGFLNESSLVAPKVNDLYNQKSIHVVEKIKRRMKNYRTLNFVLIVVVPFCYYFLGVFWYGLAFSITTFFMLRYTGRIVSTITTLDQGASSYDYLKSFESCLKDIFAKFEKLGRFSYPLYTLILNSALWVGWHHLGIVSILQHRHPTADIPLIMLSFLGVQSLLAIVFSVKVVRWEIRAVYGHLLNKLEDTIAEMEKLKQGE